MATKSTIQLRGSFEGEPVGSRSINPTDLVNLAAPSSVLNINLVTGVNVINVPSNASGCIIIFDSRSTVVKALLGAATDDGISIGNTGWIVLTLNPAGTTFRILCDKDDTDGGGTPIAFTTEVVFF